MGAMLDNDYARSLVIQHFRKNPLQERSFAAHETSQTYVHYMKVNETPGFLCSECICVHSTGACMASANTPFFALIVL